MSNQEKHEIANIGKPENQIEKQLNQMDIQNHNRQVKEKSCLDKLLNRFQINKPLLKLKISLFLFFGAGAAIAPFFQVYFKQRGLTISQLSIIYIVNPSVQFLGPAISGLIADKTGRSKPVLLANMGLATLFLSAMLFIPNINKQDCTVSDVLIDCSGTQASVKGMVNKNCNSGAYPLRNCECHFPLNTTFDGIENGYQNLKLYEGSFVPLNQFNFSLVQASFSSNSSNIVNCSRDIVIYSHGGTNSSWCQTQSAQNCSLKCVLHSSNGDPMNELCQVKEDNGNIVFACSFLLMVAFGTVFSNCYRFMDVTAMSMVKAHNADFGKQRFWTLVSVLVLSPSVGYLVGATSPDDGPKNISTAFYVFDILMLLAMLSVWRLDVKITPPGEKMWKKSLTLLKDPEVLAFTAAVVVIGSTWGFTKMFSYLYLDSLKASSILLGTIPFVNSLVGLPFLFTSNWWINKIGSANLLLFGLAAYSVFCVGYSVLVDPWYAALLEMCSVFTSHLLWVAVIRHCHEMSPEGLTSTIIALAGGVHFAVGKGTGSLIGGQIMGNFGGRWAYRVMASICAIMFVLYGSFLLLRRKYTTSYNLKKIGGSSKESGEEKKSANG